MKTLLAIAAAIAAPAFASSPPPHKLIEEAYFKCEQSKSLQGGIFGKGPTRRFGPQPGGCKANEWQRIAREEFKTLAVQWYAVDWDKDIPFFKDAQRGAPK
jgi:hypothetical protein